MLKNSFHILLTLLCQNFIKDFVSVFIRDRSLRCSFFVLTMVLVSEKYQLFKINWEVFPHLLFSGEDFTGSMPVILEFFVGILH